MSTPDQHITQAVHLIHTSPTKAVLYTTGGASHASSWLLSQPGASSTLLECRTPYSKPSFLDTIASDTPPDLKTFASTNSARALAKAAYRRAVTLAPPGTRVCGVAAACALVSTAPKKGPHRAFVTTHSSTRIVEYHLQLLKGHRNRWQEEQLTSRLVLQALLDDCATVSETHPTEHDQLPLDANDLLAVSRQSGMSLLRDLLVNGDVLHGPHVHELANPVQALLAGDVRFVEFSNALANRDATSANLIFPGSFNPLHYGHKSLMAVAKRMYPHHRAAYEISVTNPDKPSLEPQVIRQRLQQFGPDDTILLTSAPLFSIKAHLIPNSTFVIGVDTALRIVAPKYYGGEPGMLAALIQMRAKGCKFLVAGRVDQAQKTEPRYLTLSDVPIPLGLEDMFEMIPSSAFRADISSSQIRAQRPQ